MLQCIPAEDVSEWFEHETDSPYMLLAAEVQKDKRRAMTSEEEALFGIEKLNVPRSSVPAITHVDYSARIRKQCMRILTLSITP